MLLPRAASPPALLQEAEEYFGKWGDTGVVDLMQTFSDLIILTASRTLLGEPNGRAGGAGGGQGGLACTAESCCHCLGGSCLLEAALHASRSPPAAVPPLGCCRA